MVKSCLGAKRRKHETTVSLACRLHELEMRLEIDPGILTELGKLAETVRNPKQICLLFGLAGHPAVCLLVAGGIHTSKLCKPIVQLFYRTDVTMMFQYWTMKRKAQADFNNVDAFCFQRSSQARWRQCFSGILSLYYERAAGRALTINY